MFLVILGLRFPGHLCWLNLESLLLSASKPLSPINPITPKTLNPITSKP